MTCMKGLQSVCEVAKKNALVKTYLWANLQALSTEKFRLVTVQDSNWNLLFPPLGRDEAASPQHKPCLLLPVAKCGFTFGHVKLNTSYSKNYSEPGTSTPVLFWVNQLDFEVSHRAFWPVGWITSQVKKPFTWACLHWHSLSSGYVYMMHGQVAN